MADVQESLKRTKPCSIAYLSIDMPQDNSNPGHKRDSLSPLVETGQMLGDY
jgi:hypothetical protein